MPMPPTHCRKQRHRLIDTGSVLSCDSTVPPEVVSPDTASKYACVKLIGRPICCSASMIGTAASSGINTQASETSITP